VIDSSGTVGVMVATKPVDFRKGMEGLATLVRESMQDDPFSGAVYVFRAKRAERIKLIFWDGTGLYLFAKHALSRWEGLTRFIDEGCIELDKNIVERSILPITFNRKNALFAGSDGGAEHWAIIASLVETCKLNQVDPLAYLTDVLTRIANGYPNTAIDQILPGAYQRQHLKAVA
jgi:hypothetical protein